MKGHFFTRDGKLYRVTTPMAKDLLKTVIKAGPTWVIPPEKEIGPVIDLDKLDKEAATAAFLKIEMGEVGGEG